MSTNIQSFIRELDFEKALTELLLRHGWNEVIMNPTEDDLLKNWAAIIYDNNRAIDRLGDYALTPGEMRQIVNKVDMCGSPFDVNHLINGKEVCITRDNADDAHNCGKEVYLKLFDPREISAGQSRYQIARQPRFQTNNAMIGDRRGDVMLLINGMPVIHVELKRSHVDVSQACFQIKRYTHEGVFSHGIFKLVQIFVAMTPEETLYFANPGREDAFCPQFYFHWEDFNNQVESDWQQVAAHLLNIPMAHQLVGDYTIADDKDKTLKVLRSYQYFAASKISDAVHSTNWDTHNHLGGFIWHTTGSGKTMTSFKSAQLIANSGDADKVVFLLDRIELSLQSLDEYRNFAGDADSVQDTADTSILISKLKSLSSDDRLIVTSIQKMSNIKAGATITQQEIDKIGQKRLVFIIDECHRSTFGQMLVDIKRTFPRALLFGFTGTPVFKENAKNEIRTEDLFGNTLHKYTIANGITDGNVLGFDPYKVCTFPENELRELVAFHQIDLKLKERTNGVKPPRRTTEEYLKLMETDSELKEIYDHFVSELQMPDSYTAGGKTVHGIEHYLPRNLYRSDEHHLAVAQDVASTREKLSKNGKFHAMLATKSIPEAIAYYKIFRERFATLNVATVFDNEIDNSEDGIAKEDAIVQMLNDYNIRYGTTFQLSTYAKYKKDVAKRLAHKKPYTGIEADHSQQIDLLIVVSQMLTGYDSKWINTLYVDKEMKYVDVIQAFSRTNRLFGPDKPFGIIRYYTNPYTMEQNINDALEVYADQPLGVFVDKLETNLANINQRFLSISDIFKSHNIENFAKLPATREDRNMFAKLFSEMTHLLEAAKLQGFVWEQKEYEFQHGDTYTKVLMALDEQTYLTLLQRYRELFEAGPAGESKDKWEYAIDTYITELGTGTINADYINSKFQKFIKNLYMEGPDSEATKSAIQELCKTFATLAQEDQRTALTILHDIQSGDLHLEPGKTIQDYIAQYQRNELHKQIMNLGEATGINVSQLEQIMMSDVSEQNINDNNRFENLKLTLDQQKTRTFIEKVLGTTIMPFLVMPHADTLLRKFILIPEERARILLAWLTDDVALSATESAEAQQESPEQTIAPQPAPQPDLQPNQTPDPEKIKAGIKASLDVNLNHLSGWSYSQEEVIDGIFNILDMESVERLDGVGVLINRAFANIFGKTPTIVDKHVSFNLLVTKFEAYLKKLYYLMNGEEIQPREPGQDVTWGNVVHAIRPLWNLRYNEQPEYQTLYQYLNLMKGWRNDESHISPAASEQEVDAAIKVALTIYFYATGACLRSVRFAHRGEGPVNRLPD